MTAPTASTTLDVIHPEGPLEGRARTLRAQLMLVSWLSYAGFYTTRKVFSVVKGPIKATLHLNDLGVSNLFTTYLVAYTIGQFTAAWLSQRLKNRTQLLIGMSVSALCNVAMAALLDAKAGFLALASVMFVHGIAQATGWPCNIGMMAAWTRQRERGRLMAIWATSYQLGSVFAKAIASFLFGALGLLWSFWGSSIVLGVVIVLFYFWGRENPQTSGLPSFEPAITVDTTSEAKTKAAATSAKEAEGRQIQLAIVMGIIYFAFKFLRYALDSWSVLLITERFGWTTEHAGYLSTAFDWIGFLGVLFAGWLSDKLQSRVRVIFFMTIGLVVSAGLLWGVGMSSALAFGIILGFIGFTSMGPDSLLSGAAAMDTGSQKRAAIAAGIINGCGSIGPIVQEPVIGWLKTNHGVSSIMALLFGVTIAAAFGVAAFQMRLKRMGVRL